jgi:hypothetical protein
MLMFLFCCPILLVRMGAGYMVANANLGEEAMEFLVFTSPIHLDYYDFLDQRGALTGSET